MRESVQVNEASPDDRALNEAVEWLIRHEAAPLKDADLHAFEGWMYADAMHQAAWHRVNTAMAVPLSTVRNLQAQIPNVHVQAAMQALFHKRRRRVLKGALAVGSIAVTAGLVVERLTPLDQLMANLRTGTGERREFTLTDGTVVLLDARSAADVRYASGGLELLQRAGAILVKHASTRALSVRTQDGQVYMEAGQLMSRVYADRTEVVAMEGVASVTLKERSPIFLSAGEGASFNAQRLNPLLGNPLDRTSWQQGMLAVDSWPLADVATALQAYFSGFIRVAPSVADLPVFGIFRLDVQELLDTLVQTLPIRVRRLGPWISIDRR